MAAETYIPAGRTSMVKRGQTPLQVQTEYAARPQPRITTTILNSGQVLYKIEKKLDHEIESIERQQLAESVIKRQHSEVIALLRKEGRQSEISNLPSEPQKAGNVQPPSTSGSSAQNDPANTTTLLDRFREVPGVKHIFSLDAEGNFLGRATERQFRKIYSRIFKNLAELMTVFVRLPGENRGRESGVCEVERDRLYFVSDGDLCYFVTVERCDEKTDYESALKELLPTD